MDIQDSNINSEVETTLDVDDSPSYSMREAIQKAVMEAESISSDKNIWKYIGRICKVFWEGDDAWYAGRVIMYDSVRELFFVHYTDDETVEWIPFNSVGMIINQDIQFHNSWPVLVYKYSTLAIPQLKRMKGFNTGSFIEYFGTRQYQFLSKLNLKSTWGEDAPPLRYKQAFDDYKKEIDEIRIVREMVLHESRYRISEHGFTVVYVGDLGIYGKDTNKPIKGGINSVSNSIATNVSTPNYIATIANAREAEAIHRTHDDVDVNTDNNHEKRADVTSRSQEMVASLDAHMSHESNQEKIFMLRSKFSNALSGHADHNGHNNSGKDTRRKKNTSDNILAPNKKTKKEPYYGYDPQLRETKNHTLRELGWIVTPLEKNRRDDLYRIGSKLVRVVEDGTATRTITVVGFLPASRNDGISLWRVMHNSESDNISEDMNEDDLSHYKRCDESGQQYGVGMEACVNNEGGGRDNDDDDDDESVSSCDDSEGRPRKLEPKFIRIGEDYQVLEYPECNNVDIKQESGSRCDDIIWNPLDDCQKNGTDDTAKLEEFLHKAHIHHLVPGYVVPIHAKGSPAKLACCLSIPHIHTHNISVYDGSAVITLHSSNVSSLPEDMLLNIWKDSHHDLKLALQAVKSFTTQCIQSQFTEDIVTSFFLLKTHFKRNIYRIFIRSKLKSNIKFKELMKWVNLITPFALKHNRNIDILEIQSVYRCADSMKLLSASTLPERKICNNVSNIVEGPLWQSSDDDDSDVGDDDMDLDDIDDDIMKSSTMMRRMGMSLNTQSAKGKPVEQLDLTTGAVVRRYSSGNVAAKWMECSRNNLSAACRGRISRTGNFGWRFYEGPLIDFDKNPEEAWYTPIEELLKIRKAAQPRSSHHMFGSSARSRRASSTPSEYAYRGGKPVAQISLETGEVVRRYTSGSEAARAMECSQSGISACCLGNIAEMCNFTWKFCTTADLALNTDYTPIPDLLKIRHSAPSNNVIHVRNTQPRPAKQYSAFTANQSSFKGGKPVEQISLDTNQVVRRYVSGRLASIAMQCSANIISSVCRGLYKKVANFGWRFFQGTAEEFARVHLEENYVPLPKLLEIASLDADSIDAGSDSNEGSGVDETEGVDGDRVRKRRRFSTSSTKGKGKPVQQIDLSTGVVIQTFGTGREAADAVGCSTNQISMVCRGRTSQVANFGWRFLYQEVDSESDDDSEEEKEQEIVESNSGDAKQVTKVTSSTEKPDEAGSVIKQHDQEE